MKNNCLPIVIIIVFYIKFYKSIFQNKIHIILISICYYYYREQNFLTTFLMKN